MTKNEKQVILRSVVGGFCVKGMPFTSVEIANHLKRLGVWIPNRVVAEFLRNNAANIASEYGIEYKISDIHVDSFGSDGAYYNLARCYHVESFNSLDYQARDLKAITPDEFEAMHGFNPFEKEEPKKSKPEIKADKKGKISFNFPCND